MGNERLGAVPAGLIASHTTREERARLPMAQDGKALYGICYEYWSRETMRWEADIMYCLAIDEGDARVQYLRAPQPAHASRLRLVAIAPAIGYHVTDDHGEKLAAL